MRKNISNLLQKGNLTPKERSLMVVHNGVAEDREGKGFLSDADKYALVEGWQPKDNHEIKEYNKYNGGWRTVGYSELDAQTTFLQAQIAFLRANIATSYYLHTDRKKVLDRKDRFFDWSNLDGEERPNGRSVLNTVLENSGLSREYMTYRYAFDLMNEGLKQDLLKLYPDVETECDYLKAELKLYELLGDKGEASQEAREKIADLIAKRAYNEYTAALVEKKEGHEKTNGAMSNSFDLNAWSFSGYFADIPLLEVAKKCAEHCGIDYLPSKAEKAELEKAYRTKYELKDNAPVSEESILEKILTDKIEAYAEQRKTTVGELIKQTARKWLDEGLLDDHAPLFLSDKKETVNGEDTTLPHKEVFKQWLETKTKAEQKIQQMIDKGELETRMIADEILGVKREQETILGKSLYEMKGGLRFVDDYKKQAEAFMPVGFLFELIKQGGLAKQYAILLGFQDILMRLSRIYEIDLTYKVQGYIETIKRNIALLNDILRIIKDKYGSEAYMLNDCQYFMDVPQTSFVLDPDRIEPDKERLEIYYKEFEKTLGDEF
jgi:hypothetical protein